ncbi:MAG: sirohydrochlorin cobaltochelatase [Clostridia bacterium]|nr:sirohydrochlorin cobaltochelatase [Clostridia bacterium]
MKRAILAVSFGTTHEDAERSCICPVEAALAAAFPGWEVFRAWTSRMIIRCVATRGAVIEDEQAALARLRAEGYDKIAVASTHIIPGQEYDRVREAAGALPVSEPLLNDAADLRWMAGLLSDIARQEGRALLVMGHGTEHRANAVYAGLRAELPETVKLACVEGEYGLEGIWDDLEAVPGKRLTLMPLMLVAGDHAKNDLAGDGDSWKTRLRARGFDVNVRLQGLGALEPVQRRIVEKVGRIVGN